MCLGSERALPGPVGLSLLRGRPCSVPGSSLVSGKGKQGSAVMEMLDLLMGSAGGHER